MAWCHLVPQLPRETNSFLGSAVEAQRITKDLTSFKSARDSVIHADSMDFIHHLMIFVGEVTRNSLCQKALEGVHEFDFDEWWGQESRTLNDDRMPASVSFPVAPDQRFAALWGLVRSMGTSGSENLDYRYFGYLLGAHKSDDARSLAVSMVIRPFAEELTNRMREVAGMANPGLRELSGLSLAAVPGEDEVRIFLSHRSADKALVRPFAAVLREIGYEPWIDEGDMPAGTTLHRGISAGLDSSCAVVFFITQNFEDDRWLRREVDQAVKRKIERGSKFAIVTLLFQGGKVPRALEDFVYVNVDSETEAIRQIVRALPIKLGPPRWRPEVYK